MQSIIEQIEKTPIGRQANLTKHQRELLLKAIGNYRTETPTKRLGLGAMWNEYECKTPTGHYFIVSVTDSGHITITSGSPY